MLTTDLRDAPTESHLFRFHPATLTYVHVGQIACTGASGLFHRSMAVDRSGTAWLSMNDGSLNAVSTIDASCRVTGMETGQEMVQDYGMGFASVGDSTGERLFITATGGWFGPPGVPYRRLGVIDLSALTISMIGDLSAPTPANMELTGTGDGRLFGMIVDVRDLRNLVVSVEQLDPDTAATLASRIVPLEARSGFAFAHWGGDFWLFTEAPDGRARVAQYDFEAGTIVQTFDAELGIPGTIVGAGVSTCAPYDLI